MKHHWVIGGPPPNWARKGNVCGEVAVRFAKMLYCAETSASRIHSDIVPCANPSVDLEGSSISLLTPSKAYAVPGIPETPVVSVALFEIALYPLPLASFAFPSSGYHATKPACAGAVPDVETAALPERPSLAAVIMAVPAVAPPISETPTPLLDVRLATLGLEVVHETMRSDKATAFASRSVTEIWPDSPVVSERALGESETVETGDGVTTK